MISYIIYLCIVVMVSIIKVLFREENFFYEYFYDIRYFCILLGYLVLEEFIEYM